MSAQSKDPTGQTPDFLKGSTLSPRHADESAGNSSEASIYSAVLQAESAYRAEIGRLRKQNAELERKVTVANEGLDGVKAAFEAERLTAQGATEELTKTRAELASAKNYLQRYRAEHKRLTECIKPLQKNLEDLKARAEKQIAKAQADAEARVSAFKAAANERLAQAIDCSNSERKRAEADARSKYESAERAARTEAAKAVQLQVKVAALNPAAVHAELKIARAETARVTALANQLKFEGEKLRAEANRARDLQAETVHLREEIDRLHVEAKRLHVEAATATRLRDEIEIHKAKADEALNLQEEIVSARVGALRADKLQAELQVSEAQLQETRARAAALEARVHELSTDKARVEASLAASVEAKLSSALEGFERTRNGAEAATQETQRARDALERLSSQGRVESDSLKSELRAALGEIERLRTLYPVKDMIAARDEELAQLREQASGIPQDHPAGRKIAEAMTSLQGERDRLQAVFDELRGDPA